MNITTLVLSNLYGPNDNFDKDLGHVIPSLIAFVQQKILRILYVKDICDAVRFSITNKVPKGVYNVGSGDEYTIEQIANLIKEICVYYLIFLNLERFMDSSKFNNLGWPDEGLLETINYYKNIRIELPTPCFSDKCSTD